MRLALLLALMLAGCATDSALVCRHHVLSHAAWAAEQGLESEIVVYEVSPLWSLGAYNAHAQARTSKGWVSEVFGMATFSEHPDYPPTGWMQGYKVDKYWALMWRNCFNRADCRDEGVPY